MIFGPEHYVPVLKIKRGEKAALRSLDSKLCRRITPLLEVVERKDDKAPTIDAHLTTAFKDLAESVRLFPRCFLDAREIASDGPTGANEVFQRATDEGIVFTPVTGISRTGPHGEMAFMRDGVNFHVFQPSVIAQFSIPGESKTLTHAPCRSLPRCVTHCGKDGSSSREKAPAGRFLACSSPFWRLSSSMGTFDPITLEWDTASGVTRSKRPQMELPSLDLWKSGAFSELFTILQLSSSNLRLCPCLEILSDGRSNFLDVKILTDSIPDQPARFTFHPTIELMLTQQFKCVIEPK